MIQNCTRILCLSIPTGFLRRMEILRRQTRETLCLVLAGGDSSSSRRRLDAKILCLEYVRVGFKLPEPHLI